LGASQTGSMAAKLATKLTGSLATELPIKLTGKLAAQLTGSLSVYLMLIVRSAHFLFDLYSKYIPVR
jgi:hypothetical protein